MITHETFVQRIRELVIERSGLSTEQIDRLRATKLVYGIGRPGVRGQCFYEAWQNGGEVKGAFVEICALAEQNPVQLAGTTLHELAQVLAGFGAGHGKEWKAVCDTLGLRRAEAAGQRYLLAQLAPSLRASIAALLEMADGSPDFRGNAQVLIRAPRPCGAARGSKGGKSTGTGSGSRMIKVVCAEHGYTARTTRKWLEAMGPPLCPCGEAMIVEVK